MSLNLSLKVKEEMLFEALTTRKTVTVGERLIVPYKLAEVSTTFPTLLTITNITTTKYNNTTVPNHTDGFEPYLTQSDIITASELQNSPTEWRDIIYTVLFMNC